MTLEPNSRYSIVVFGSGAVAKKFLEKLLQFHRDKKLNIEAVVVCENEKNPRYIKGKPDVVREYAEENNIKILTDPDELIGLDKKYSFGLSLGNHFILRKRHIELFDFGVINFHGAPILWYRGVGLPVIHILKKDTPQWGFTYHLIDEEIDKGVIVKQVIYDIPEGLNSKQIDATVLSRAIEDFPEFINQLLAEGLKIIPEISTPDFSKAMFVKRKDLNNDIFSEIELDNDKLDRLIRAYDWPEIVEHPFIKVNGKAMRLVPDETYKEMLKIFRDSINNYQDSSA